MRGKKAAVLVTCLSLVGAVTLGGTLALLTKPSNAVTNTFTVGAGLTGLVLQEHTVDKDDSIGNFGGYKTNSGITSSGNSYSNLIGDTKLDKDPFFTLSTGSCDAYIIAKMGDIDKSIFTEVTAGSNSGWHKLTLEKRTDGKVTNITAESTAPTVMTAGEYYVYETKLSGGGSTGPLFVSLTTKSTMTPTNSNSVQDLTVIGVAVQADAADSYSNQAVLRAGLQALGEEMA